MMLKKIPHHFWLKKILNKLTDKTLGEILILSNKINYDHLTYHYNSKNKRKQSFNNFDTAFSFSKKIRDDTKTIKESKSLWIRFKYNKKGKKQIKRAKQCIAQY